MEKESIIVDFLTEKMPFVKGIYLFGSHAAGHADAESDFDIAFLNEHSHAPDQMRDYRFSLDLGRSLGATVDLVDLQNAETDFRFVIISTSKRLYCLDQTFCDTFEMLSYSMYQRLEEERKLIIEDIKKRGSIYG